MLIITDYFELLLPPCAYIRDACWEQLPRRNVGAGTFLPRASVGLTALHRMAPASSHLQAFSCISLQDALTEKPPGREHGGPAVGNPSL